MTGRVTINGGRLYQPLRGNYAGKTDEMTEIDRLSKICARAIADANITNCYPHEARPVVEAILSAVGICVGPDAPQEPCGCQIGDCTKLTRRCREMAA